MHHVSNTVSFHSEHENRITVPKKGAKNWVAYRGIRFSIWILVSLFPWKCFTDFSLVSKKLECCNHDRTLQVPYSLALESSLGEKRGRFWRPQKRPRKLLLYPPRHWPLSPICSGRQKYRFGTAKILQTFDLVFTHISFSVIHSW